MDIFVHHLTSLSPKRILGKTTAELQLVGTTLTFPFLSSEEQLHQDNKHALPLKEIKAEIDSLKKIDCLLIKGGEPLLQSQALLVLLEYAKKRNLLVALETYGSKPLVLQECLKRNLIDIVLLKLYSPLTLLGLEKTQKQQMLLNQKQVIKSIKESISLLEKGTCMTLVRSMVVPGLLYKKTDFLHIIKSISNIPRVMVELSGYKPTENFRNIESPSPEFITELKATLMQRFPQIRIL